MALKKHKTKKSRRGKKIAGTKGKTLGMDEIVDQAQRILISSGSEAMVAAMEKIAAKAANPDGRPVNPADFLTTVATYFVYSNQSAAMALLKRVEVLAPEALKPRLLMANIHDSLGKWNMAREAALEVIRSQHATPDEVLNSANLLIRFENSRFIVKAAWEAFIRLNRPLRWSGPLLFIALKAAEWTLAEELISQIRKAYDAGQFTTNEGMRSHLLWCDDEKTNQLVVRAWAYKFQIPNHNVIAPPYQENPDGRRLRVGYLSSDFREHPVAHLINGLFRHHDRDNFEIFLYCSGWDDGSIIRQDIMGHCEHVYSVSRLSDTDTAELMRKQELDILVELNGPTQGNRMGVLAHQPAPVSIGYIGWPGSYGGRVVHYIVADDYTVPPESRKHYPEKIIYMQNTYMINDHKAWQLPPPPPCERLELPKDQFLILGMFNSINKVREPVWAVWMQILKQVPEAWLWILDPGPAARQNLGKSARKHGVDPSRIGAAPKLKHDAHLARLQHCDLMLDPWPYGGHTCTFDALFAGVPVLALQGNNIAGRVGGGILRDAGLEELVQPDPDAYVRKAVEVLGNPNKLKRLQRFVREEVPGGIVFDARKKTRQLEAAYYQVIKRAAQGLPPADIACGTGY